VQTSIPKVALAREVQRLIIEKDLSQVAAAAVVRDAPSQISLLMSGRLEGFSAERLLRMLVHLGRDVELVITRSRRPQRTGRIRVTLGVQPRRRGPRARQR
jgi:predicted XRE-type DNA-binding protein